MIFAQMPTPTPGALAAFIVSGAALIWALNQGLKLADRFKAKPPTGELNVSFEALTMRVEALEQREHEHESRRRALYDHIDKVRIELKNDIKDMQDKVDQIPNQVIVLLKHTGALRSK
jgi:hypothetical protein